MLCLIGLQVNAQNTAADSTKKQYSNILSIDATSLLSNFRIILADDLYYYEYFTSPYILSYKRIFKNEALRVSIGGGFGRSTYHVNSGTTDYVTSARIAVGIGYEHRINLSKRWLFYYGADGLFRFGYTQNKAGSSGDQYLNELQEIKVGAAPLLGLELHLGKRISIGTEMSLELMYMSGTKKFEYSGNPYYTNEKQTTTSFSTQFHAPTAFNIVIAL